MHPGEERRYGVDIEAYDRWLVWGHGLRLRRGRVPGMAESDVDGETDSDLGDQAVLEASLAAVAPYGAQLVARFYELLFADNPRLRALFPDQMDVQREKLLAALIAAVQGASDPQALIEVLQQLGRDHRKFGVRPAHFASVGKALVAALSQFAGPAWTPEVEQAWLARYTFAARTMLAAADDDGQHPPYWYGTIVAHQRYLPDVAILRVRPHQPYRFQPGQHATLVSQRVQRVWRPYVMANAPASDNLLEFHVRAGGAGGLGEALVADAKVGDTLRVGAPMGTAILRLASARTRLFVTAGVGWAQTKAYLSRLAVEPPSPAYLLYIGQSESAVYDPELRRLFALCPWLMPAFVRSEGEAADRLAPLRPDQLEVYVSGTAGGMASRLIAAGVSRAHLIDTTWP